MAVALAVWCAATFAAGEVRRGGVVVVVVAPLAVPGTVVVLGITEVETGAFRAIEVAAEDGWWLVDEQPADRRLLIAAATPAVAKLIERTLRVSPRWS
jgi:hypothetical protein